MKRKFYNTKFFKFIFDTKKGRKLYDSWFGFNDGQVDFAYSKDDSIIAIISAVLLLVGCSVLNLLVLYLNELVFIAVIFDLLFLFISVDLIFKAIIAKYIRELGNLVVKNYHFYQIDAVLSDGTVIDSDGNRHTYDYSEKQDEIVIVDNSKNILEPKKFIGYVLKEYDFTPDFYNSISDSGIIFIRKYLYKDIYLVSCLIKKYQIEEPKYKYLKNHTLSLIEKPKYE